MNPGTLESTNTKEYVRDDKSELESEDEYNEDRIENIRRKYLYDSQQHAQRECIVPQDSERNEDMPCQDDSDHYESDNNTNHYENNLNEIMEKFVEEDDVDVENQVQEEGQDNEVNKHNNSVAVSSITNSDGSLNLLQIPVNLQKTDLIKMVEKLNGEIMEMKKTKLTKTQETSTNPIIEGTIKHAVKNCLFPKVQFIRYDAIFDDCRSNKSIGKFVMDICNIPDKQEQRELFWNTYKIVVRKQIKIQRNVVHTSLKRKFFGKKSRKKH